MRKKLTVLAALICLACLGYLAQTWRAIWQAREEHASMANLNQEVQRLTEQNESIAQLREQVTGTDALKKENADLPKLRNEARQLRRKVEELDRLRSENQQLLAAQRSSSNSKASRSLPANFISKASLVDAGLATPEATVQTMFWAATQGNVDRAMQCQLNPGNLPSGEKQHFQETMKDQFSRFQGFGIKEKKVISEDEIEMSIQGSAGGASLKLLLPRIGGEWKIKEGL